MILYDNYIYIYLHETVIFLHELGNPVLNQATGHQQWPVPPSVAKPCGRPGNGTRRVGRVMSCNVV